MKMLQSKESNQLAKVKAEITSAAAASKAGVSALLLAAA
jgi:hypothetical protein